MEEVKKNRQVGLKIIRSPYEDEIIAWFKIHGQTILQVKDRLKSEKKYNISYTCISNYYNKVLPTITEERLDGIRKKLDLNRVEKESVLITKLSELENSIDYLRRLGLNIETMTSSKNKFIEVKKIKENTLVELKVQLDKELDKTKKDGMLVEYSILSGEIIDCDRAILSFMNMENKTTKLQQDIRIDINKVLGETWQLKIQQIIDSVAKGVLDVFNPCLIDEKREEAKKRMREHVERCYNQYGVKLK